MSDVRTLYADFDREPRKKSSEDEKARYLPTFARAHAGFEALGCPVLDGRDLLPRCRRLRCRPRSGTPHRWPASVSRATRRAKSRRAPRDALRRFPHLRQHLQMDMSHHFRVLGDVLQLSAVGRAFLSRPQAAFSRLRQYRLFQFTSVAGCAALQRRYSLRARAAVPERVLL